MGYVADLSKSAYAAMYFTALRCCVIVIVMAEPLVPNRKCAVSLVALIADADFYQRGVFIPAIDSGSGSHVPPHARAHRRAAEKGGGVHYHICMFHSSPGRCERAVNCWHYLMHAETGLKCKRAIVPAFCYWM